MKASELITALQAAIEKHGDMQVAAYDCYGDYKDDHVALVRGQGVLVIDPDPPEPYHEEVYYNPATGEVRVVEPVDQKGGATES